MCGNSHTTTTLSYSHYCTGPAMPQLPTHVSLHPGTRSHTPLALHSSHPICIWHPIPAHMLRQRTCITRSQPRRVDNLYLWVVGEMETKVLVVVNVEVPFWWCRMGHYAPEMHQIPDVRWGERTKMWMRTRVGGCSLMRVVTVKLVAAITSHSWNNILSFDMCPWVIAVQSLWRVGPSSTARWKLLELCRPSAYRDLHSLRNKKK